MGRVTTLTAALAAAASVAFAAMAIDAQAAVRSVGVQELTATIKLDGADDDVTVAVADGLIVHDQTTAGVNSGKDWDSSVDGDQAVPADGTFTLIISGGEGNDTITVLAKDTELASAGLGGDEGDDVLIGSDSNETLEGGDGDDRLVAGKGDDAMRGGAGNDTLVWNQGDGSDFANGDAGDDGAEVTGSPTAGDVFTLDPAIGRVILRRTNFGQFRFDALTERLAVNGLGGNDSITANDGVGAITVLSLDGGSESDTLEGSEGADSIHGGNGVDFLSGGAGSDRLAGDGGTDVVSGDEGDDAIEVRDGTVDLARGGDGADSAVADGADVDVLDGFESVDRPPVVTPAPVDAPPVLTPPPVDTATRPVGIAGGTLRVNRGKVAIELSCPAAAPVNCAGALAVRTAKSVRRGGVKAVLELGAARYDVPVGASRSLQVKLPTGSGRLADRKRRLEVRAAASTGAQGAIARSSRRLTLRFGAR